MKLYIPQIKDKLRLTAPLVVSIAETNNVYGCNFNHETAFAVNYPGEPWNYKKAEAIKDFTLIEGTVLAIRRYHVSVHAKTNDVQVSIFAHPRADLTPKTQGGKSHMLKLTLPIEVMNRIEYEKLDV